MKRTTLIAALTGAVLLLAGCGSKSGTAAPASSASSVPAAAASSAAVAPVSEAPVSEAPVSEAPSSDSAGASPESSPAESTPADSGSMSSSAPATTVGDASSALDADSTKWFDTFCTGFGSFANLTSASSSLSSEKDPKVAQTKLVQLFTEIGGTFTSTAKSLKDLPPPSFTGGPEFAGKIIPVMTQFGSALTEAATKASAVDVTKDPSGLETALSGVASSVTAVGGSLSDLQNLKITPQTQAAIEAIPACGKLKSLGG